jgi:hypothetical protein
MSVSTQTCAVRAYREASDSITARLTAGAFVGTWSVGIWRQDDARTAIPVQRGARLRCAPGRGVAAAVSRAGGPNATLRCPFGSFAPTRRQPRPRRSSSTLRHRPVLLATREPYRCRRRGPASELVGACRCHAQSNAATRCVLQASPSGRPAYAKSGSRSPATYRSSSADSHPLPPPLVTDARVLLLLKAFVIDGEVARAFRLRHRSERFSGGPTSRHLALHA